MDMKKERKGINTATLERIREFLKSQDGPVYISDIVKKLHINLYSAKFALTIIKHRINAEGKIYLRKR